MLNLHEQKKRGTKLQRHKDNDTEKSTLAQKVKDPIHRVGSQRKYIGSSGF